MRANLIRCDDGRYVITVPEINLAAIGTVNNIRGFLSSTDFKNYCWEGTSNISNRGRHRGEPVATRFITRELEPQDHWPQFKQAVASRWLWCWMRPDIDAANILSHKLTLPDICEMSLLFNLHGFDHFRNELSRRYDIPADSPYLTISGTRPELREAAFRFALRKGPLESRYRRLARELRDVAKHMSAPQTAKFAFCEPPMQRRSK